eukprot:3940536-Rhodomonas_salina.1
MVPISLRACYAMSSTDLAHGATRHQQVCILQRGRGGRAEVSICLRVCRAMSGTGIAYGLFATPGTKLAPGAIGLRTCYAMSGTELAFGATSDELTFVTASSQVSSPSCLRARYAMSGTGIAYGAIVLCACYAMSGIDIAYVVTMLCDVRY